MTDLADRIHALTGADRAIDAEVRMLLFGDCRYGMKGPPNAPVPGTLSEYVSAYRDLLNSDDALDDEVVPRFTASLHATLAEIKRRGWGTSHVGSILTPQCRFSIHIDQAGTSFDAYRKDDNLALAALEALVRAVEAGDAE